MATMHRTILFSIAAPAKDLPQAVRQALYDKQIVWDRESRDYAMYLDGELVGFARTYHEAEVTLDQLVFELISGQYFAQNDVCWSCGDQLQSPTHGPALCGACLEAGEQWPEIKPTLHAALHAEPDGTAPDDYSTVPAGPGEPE